MSQRKKPRTLFARKGTIWMDDDPFDSFSAAPKIKDAFDEIFSELLKKHSIATSMPKASSYATTDDLLNLEKRLDFLESRLNKITESQKPNKLASIEKYLMTSAKELGGFKKIFCQVEGTIIDFFIISDQFSNDLLDKISEIEIILSRKFPKLSINLEPTFCDEEVPEGSHLVLVNE